MINTLLLKCLSYFKIFFWYHHFTTCLISSLYPPQPFSCITFHLVPSHLLSRIWSHHLIFSSLFYSNNNFLICPQSFLFCFFLLPPKSLTSITFFPMSSLPPSFSCIYFIAHLKVVLSPSSLFICLPFWYITSLSVYSSCRVSSFLFSSYLFPIFFLIPSCSIICLFTALLSSSCSHLSFFKTIL